MKLRKILLTVISLLLLFSLPAYAHSGRTDGAGGHYNRSTGEYHYHHGHPAHQHPNGVCPYRDKDDTVYFNNTAAADDKSEDIDWFGIVLVGICSFAVGSFSFCQIIGVIRTRRYRLKRMIILTIIIWTAVLIFTAFAIHAWFFNYRIAFYTAMIISLFLSRKSGKISSEEATDLAIKTAEIRRQKLLKAISKRNALSKLKTGKKTVQRRTSPFMILGIAFVAIGVLLLVVGVVFAIVIMPTIE